MKNSLAPMTLRSRRRAGGGRWMYGSLALTLGGSLVQQRPQGATAWESSPSPKGLQAAHSPWGVVHALACILWEEQRCCVSGSRILMNPGISVWSHWNTGTYCYTQMELWEALICNLRFMLLIVLQQKLYFFFFSPLYTVGDGGGGI